MIEILERIGDVCYWTGFAAAGLFLARAIEIVSMYLISYSHILTPDEIVQACAPMTVYAFLCWSAGRASKYVLAGT
jgi:hypothetical protein